MIEQNKKRLNMALRPDAQGFDEVRIFTVPRYKQSGLSGDEWRISATVQFYRKGQLIFEEGCGSVEVACGLAYGYYVRGQDNGRGYFASVEDRCDQEGCAEKATVLYRVLRKYCRDGSVHEESASGPQYRQFCEKHKTRGDCGLDDADRNYELVNA
jgi:hypothetical protein